MLEIEKEVLFIIIYYYLYFIYRNIKINPLYDIHEKILCPCI